MKRTRQWQVVALTVIVGALLSTPDEAVAEETCLAGGPGATSCTYNWSIPGGGGQSCSVTCGSGFYACCNVGTCRCSSGSPDE